MERERLKSPTQPTPTPRERLSPVGDKFDPELIRDISVAVYRSRFEDDDRGSADRYIAKSGADKFRRNAAMYDIIVRETLRALKQMDPNFKPPDRL